MAFFMNKFTDYNIFYYIAILENRDYLMTVYLKIIMPLPPPLFSQQWLLCTGKIYDLRA